MVQGVKKILIFLLLACLHLFATSVSGQKVYKDNFTKIAKSYLEYATSNPYEKFTNCKLVLDTSSTFFIISTDTEAKDSIWFEITFRRTDISTNRKYRQVYSLGNFKLVIDEGFDSSGILTGLFRKRPYENLNKGEPYNGVSSENFHAWHVLMNRKYEIVYAHSGFPQQRELIEILKKNKVKFVRNFAQAPD